MMRTESQDPLSLSAVALAARIRTGALSPLEVVEEHIRRIEAVNPELNAVVAERFDAARAEARAAEQRIGRGDSSPPLLGVPFTVKEMISLEGMPHTLGTLARRDRAAERDATIVQRLRAAGAIPLGATNVPEWGFWFETYNLIHGRTRNPYDPARTSGGSSGGEGAIVGAGGAPFGLGSDIGGSIRMPAAFCGVFGHKPTHGLLPLTGHYPVYIAGPDAGLPKENPYVVVGPLARSAEDLLPLLRLMSGPDGVDPNAEALEIGPPEVGWEGRRVLLLDAPRIRLAGRTVPGLRRAVERAAGALEERGAVVEPLPADLFRDAVELWSAALRSIDGPGFGETIGVDRWSRVAAELARSLVRRPRFSLPVLLFCLQERLAGLSRRRARHLLAETRRLTDRIAARLGRDGVLLMPPHPRPAPKHRRPFLRPFDFAYTAILNVLRVPVTVAPMGLDGRGLPLAVQIASARGNDAITIAAARVLEEDFGGWTPPRLHRTGRIRHRERATA